MLSHDFPTFLSGRVPVLCRLSTFRFLLAPLLVDTAVHLTLQYHALWPSPRRVSRATQTMKSYNAVVLGGTTFNARHTRSF